MPDKVRCPKCNRKQSARPGDVKDVLYWCPSCNMQFDAMPDEGSDYSDHNPAARMERQERQRKFQGRR